jgi:hypothetical protein
LYIVRPSLCLRSLNYAIGVHPIHLQSSVCFVYEWKYQVVRRLRRFGRTNLQRLSISTHTHVEGVSRHMHAGKKGWLDRCVGWTRMHIYTWCFNYHDYMACMVCVHYKAKKIVHMACMRTRTHVDISMSCVKVKTRLIFCNFLLTQCDAGYFYVASTNNCTEVRDNNTVSPCI